MESAVHQLIAHRKQLARHAGVAVHQRERAPQSIQLELGGYAQLWRRGDIRGVQLEHPAALRDIGRPHVCTSRTLRSNRISKPTAQAPRSTPTDCERYPAPHRRFTRRAAGSTWCSPFLELRGKPPGRVMANDRKPSASRLACPFPVSYTHLRAHET